MMRIHQITEASILQPLWHRLKELTALYVRCNMEHHQHPVEDWIPILIWLRERLDVDSSTRQIQAQRRKLDLRWNAGICNPRNQKSSTQIYGQSFNTEKTQKKKTQWKTDASNALEALFFHGQHSPGRAVPGESQGNLDLSKPRWNMYPEELRVFQRWIERPTLKGLCK